MLYDNAFLQELDLYPHKVIHIRMIAIDYNDNPIEAIEGRITSGNISVSGTSAIQRTCNLTFIVPEDHEITEANWAFKTKFKLEIGLENYINAKYEPIIWFKQGVFIIKSFNKNIQKTGGIQISISGMDKMCMLNGILGGTLTADVNFGEIDTIAEDGTITTNKVKIYTIIQQALQQFGNERQGNIIINDLDDYGYELWTYRGDSPLYLIGEVRDNQYQGIINMTTDQNATLKDQYGNVVNLSSGVDKYYSTNTLDPNYNKDMSIFQYHQEDNFQANVIKIDYGETAGYYPTPLVYAGDLIENAGSTVTTMLDKIVNMLGNFEYFYNVEGQFVFQKKQNYIQEIFSPVTGEIYMPNVLVSQYAYQFKDAKLLTNLSYSPAIDKIRNDFSVWGTAKGISGAEIPIHARCAIDVKPTQYVSPYTGITYISNEYYQDQGEKIYCDWREVIYQMAIDFYSNNTNPTYVYDITTQNPSLVNNGLTGYESYYVDLQGFWRQLYDPAPTEDKIEEYYSKDDNTNTYRCWTKKIHTDPNSLKFWFDFLDPGEAPLSAYSVNKIGSRPKVNNSSSVKTIYYKDTPEVLFLVPPMMPDDYTTMAYKPLWIPYDMKALFTLSTQGMSAIEQINVELNENACLGEGISFSTIPIYYLLPNTRIEILGEDYLLTSISYSFGANATMNLTGSKIIKSIV